MHRRDFVLPNVCYGASMSQGNGCLCDVFLGLLLLGFEGAPAAVCKPRSLHGCIHRAMTNLLSTI